jgi:hypothetical protein
MPFDVGRPRTIAGVQRPTHNFFRVALSALHLDCRSRAAADDERACALLHQARKGHVDLARRGGVQYHELLSDSDQFRVGGRSGVEMEIRMKVSVAAIVILSTALTVADGFCQERGRSSATASRNSSDRAQSVSIPRTPTIRVTGAPRIQPTPGIECTPAEQEIVGAIVGPSNLCGR